MYNHMRDNKYDENLIDKLAQAFNWQMTQIQRISDNPTAIVWDLDSGGMKGTLDITESIDSVSLTPDGLKALTCAGYGVVLWDLTNLTKIADIKQDISASYTSAVFSPDGNKFAVSFFRLAQGHYFQIYDSEGKPLGDELRSETPIISLCWFSDNIRLIINSYFNTLSVVDSTNGRVQTTKTTNGIDIHSVSVSPDDSKIAIACNDKMEEKGLVQILDAKNLNLKNSLLLGLDASAVTFNNTGDRVIFSCSQIDEFLCDIVPIVIWDYANKVIDRIFSGHDNYVTSLTRCRANNTLFFSGGADGRVLLWDMETGYVVKRLKGRSYIVNCVDLSADCRIGISGQQSIAERIVKLTLENDFQMITRRG